MARPESALSLELERSMNMQVRVETFEEHLRHGEIKKKSDNLISRLYLLSSK